MQTTIPAPSKPIVSTRNRGLEKIQLGSMVALGGGYLATTMVSLVIYGEALARGVQSLDPVGAVAVVGGAAALSLGVAAVGNLKDEDLKKAGASVKKFGEGIVESMTALASKFGLVKDGQAPLEKVTEDQPKTRSYWANTVVDATRLALVAPLIFSTVTAGAYALSIPLGGYDNMATAAITAGALGAASVVSMLGMKGLNNIKQNLQTKNWDSESVTSIVKSEAVDKPAAKRAADNDMQLG